MKHFFPLIALLVLTACGSNSSNTATTETKDSTAAPATTTTTAATETKASPVSFYVNDSIAQTNPIGKDDDEQLGMFNVNSNALSLDFMGDVASRPHRGWLHFSIVGFKLEPGSYSISKDVQLSFSRYETENAGGEHEYVANTDATNAGTDVKIEFTKVEEDKTNTIGTNYLASGTFSAKLVNKVYGARQGAKEEVIISKGSFENIRIAVLGQINKK